MIEWKEGNPLFEYMKYLQSNIHYAHEIGKLYQDNNPDIPGKRDRWIQNKVNKVLRILNKEGEKNTIES